MSSKHVLAFLTFLVLVSTIGIAACASSSSPMATSVPATATSLAAPTTAAPEPTATPMSAAFPITVIDGLGREVSVEALPQRIVSLAPSNTEILFAVGAGDQVVGVTKYCDYPSEAQTREQVGGFSAKTISVERIVALEPDLVFSAGKLQTPVIEALEKVNITVVALDARTLDDVYGNIELVGQLTGHGEEAAQIVASMRERVDAVVTKVAEIPQEERLTVYWETFDEPLMTAGPGTFIGQMIEMAGGINIFADVTESYPEISAEEVAKRNPDVIMSMDSHGKKITPDVLAGRPGWGEIKAVKNGRIHLIGDNLVSRPGPRLADALETMAKALYPDLFAD